MPPYANFQQFMTMVRGRNTHYERHKNSSLHDIVEELQKPTPNKQRVQQLRNGLAADKKQKYSQALGFLDNDYLNPKPTGGVQVLPQSVVLSAQQLRQVTPNVATGPGVVAGGALQPIGWRLQAYNYSNPLPVAQQVDDLNTIGIARINEAMTRTPAAVEAARDAITRISTIRRNNTPTNQLSRKDQIMVQAFTDFFGAFDADRFERIRENFEVLALAFKNVPNFSDWRNDRIWANTFGGCVRRNLRTRTTQGALALTGAVDIRFGQAFLRRGTYEVTSDATIATLVHEFAHGAVNAVDVPEVDATGTFQWARQSDDPTDPDFGNSTDPHNHQSSNEADDKLLAHFKPEYAVVNADNYAQFTTALLLAAGR